MEIGAGKWVLECAWIYICVFKQNRGVFTFPPVSISLPLQRVNSVGVGTVCHWAQCLQGAQWMNHHSQHYTGPCVGFGGGAVWIEQLSPMGQWQSIDWCQNHSRPHTPSSFPMCAFSLLVKDRPPSFSPLPLPSPLSPFPPSFPHIFLPSLPPERTTSKQTLMKKRLEPLLLGFTIQ